MRISEPTRRDIAYVAYRMRDSDAREFLAVSDAETQDQLVDRLVARFGADPNVIIAHDEFPVAVGIVARLRPKVVTLGFFATEDMPLVAGPLTRFIRQRLFARLKEAGVHRIEAVSIEGYKQAHRWLEALGLKHEAEHKSFGKGGETFHTFAWTA